MRPLLLAALLGAAALPMPGAPPKKASPSRPTKEAQAAKVPELPPAGAPGELVDLATGWSLALGPVRESRTDFQATPLPDGRVLVTGGSAKGATSEWLDPATRAFAAGPPMVQARAGHRALALPDGRVLLLGGTEQPTAPELLEVGAARFTALPGDATFGLSAEAVVLDGGTVLLIDGPSGACWTWDGRGKPRPTGGLQQARLFFRALRLPDGRVLVTGGWPAPPPAPDRRFGRRPTPAPTTTLTLAAESYLPRKSRWSLWKGTLPARARHQMALLPDGKVALLGGFGADPSQAVDTVDLLDPASERLSTPGPLPASSLSPGWADLTPGGLFLAERSTALARVERLEDLLQPPATAVARLANAFLAPLLVPLPERRLLVLGSPVWGPGLERWDPRTRQFAYVGALRAGTESLALLEGKVVALGPVADQLDPRTGALTPLGRREALAARLAKAKGYQGSAKVNLPPFPDGQARTDALVVTLDAGRALVLGGRTDAQPEGTDQAWVLDLKKKTLTPTGPMKAKRAFPGAPKAGEGALRLPDGSVLVWGS